ncbi:MAG TPA: PucR family transcriptional regulator [Micromonosporaceae bacterium]|nr:PucR family transcriptional regulator [Micromonosporaceae bacterium]
MRLRTLLDLPDLKLELLSGEPELDRPIQSVMTTDLPDPSRYLHGGELVLTGMIWRRSPDDSALFVKALADAGVCALAAGDGSSGEIPDDLRTACHGRGLPLLRVPADIAFATVTEEVVRRLSPVRADDVTDFLGRHRHLVSASVAAEGDGLAAVLDLVRQQLSMRCWVISPTGQEVAANAPPLPEDVKAQALRHYLSGKRIPYPLPAQAMSVLSAGDPTQPRVVNWLLICDSDVTQWEPQHHQLARELTALVEAEHRRLDSTRQARRAAACDLVQMITADADPTELAYQLKHTGLPADGTLVVVAAQLAGGLARPVLEDLLGRLPAAVAVLDQTAFAIVAGDPEQVRQAIDQAVNLAPALANSPLRIGVSGTATGAPGLRGALDEARHACAMAGMSRECVTIIGEDELTSHVMLLAAVPDGVRRAFRDRLLGPLLEYDRVHRADLVPTLRAFLAYSGSWTKCAEVLHVHVNTLRYRIQRIEQLTGRDLGKLDSRVDLFLALALAGNP